jgi:deoxyxylulose-5-phosphate synthase
MRRRGERIAILAFGTLLHPALAAAETLDATVADMRFVKPLDDALVLELARTHEALVTVEEGCVMGGAGSAVASAWPRPAWRCRCCSWACPTSSPSTATRPSCWRCTGWMPPASSKHPRALRQPADTGAAGGEQLKRIQR